MQNVLSTNVRNADFISIFNAAYAEVVRLKARFLRPYLSRRDFESTSYELPVKAFCVLAHAVLEQCFEEIALATVLNRKQQFDAGGDVSRTLLMLIAFHGSVVEIPRNEDDICIRTFDLLRGVIEEAHRRFSRSVNDNHGIFFPHLAALLSPAGLDLQLEPEERDAIKLLKQARGEHAHTAFTRTIVNPEDAIRYVYRILVIAKRVSLRAAELCVKPGDEFHNFRMPSS